MSYDDEDPPEEIDTPPSEPAGSVSVAFDVPVPTLEQVAGAVARQIFSGYSNEGARRKIAEIAQAKLDAMVDELVAEKARPIIEELLARPFQLTDRYGNPTGTPTTALAVLAERVEGWATDQVGYDGNPPRDDYHRRDSQPRINYLLKKLVDNELSQKVDAEVRKIVDQLKSQATNGIAKQVADRIASLVFKP